MDVTTTSRWRESRNTQKFKSVDNISILVYITRGYWGNGIYCDASSNPRNIGLEWAGS